MSRNQILLVILIILLVLSTYTAHASERRFESDDPAKKPFSVPLSKIQKRINNDPSADGIVLSASTINRVLCIDIKEIPGETSAAAVLRVVMMIGRLAEDTYTEMCFADEGVDVFIIDGEKIREIGVQFVWGEEGEGQNPIHLIRLFADALRTPDGQRVSPPMTGSLLGDTQKALETINKRFHPEWTMRTLKVH
ncbi:MAG: hypothetical protein U5L00_04360 [Desulfovermiculus sp.]|jgi:hypothetical protein|nr:hypothetical protein [Desulfovermiculus sp.]